MTKLKALIVEDNKYDAEMAIKDLKQHGFEVEFDIVETPEAMSKALDEKEWDIILTDYQMPRFTGPEAIKLLQGTGRDIPIIMISGTVGEETAVSSLQNGAEDFLVKGQLARLSTAVERALRESENRRARRKAEQELNESHALLQKYTQKLEQSNKELEHFATIASHDLQAPLRKVRAFGDMLKNSDAERLSPDGKDYLERMLKATERMQLLITDLLDLSRINRKGKPFEETDLNQVASQVLDELLEYRRAVKGQVEVEPLCTIDADPSQMHQLLKNLIENGLKFHKTNEAPTVRVSTEFIKEDGQTFCCIHVKDNGIGIKEEYQDKIFEIFQRLHGMDAYPGTGIGLALVKKIVERHEGTVMVQSTMGEGSIFTVRMPQDTDDYKHQAM